jgi:hypothetical protein
MAWSDRAVARARLAAAKARDVSKELLEAADEQLAHSSDGYVAMKAASKTLHDETTAAMKEQLQRFGSTAAGAKVGAGTRRGIEALVQLPVVSVPIDALKARYGVDLLFERLREEPAEPLRAVQLVEAMDRMQADLRVYRTARSVVDPVYILRRAAMVTAAQLGDDAHDSTRLALLKRAFVQSRRRLADVSADPHALHALARVYAAQGDTTHASAAAALSYRAKPSDPLPLVTLARCHLIDEDDCAAQAIARRAVAEGADYGNELLANVVLRHSHLSVSELVHEFESLRSKVTPEGRIAYAGCIAGGSVVWRALKSGQADRIGRAATRVKEISHGLGI